MLGKARWLLYESRHQKETHTADRKARICCSLQLGSSLPRQGPAMLSRSSEHRRRLVEELIKAQDKSLLAQVSLLCHLFQMPSGKARAALQEAQEQYKPKGLKCQEEHPVGK